MASGAPVVGFDTGALSKLVPKNAGILVPYGGDPWKLETPDFEGLAKAVRKVLKNWHEYSSGARSIAKERFGFDQMMNAYLRVSKEAIERKEDLCIGKR